MRADPIGGVKLSEPGGGGSIARASDVGEGLRGEVMRGLLSTPKWLPPRLFYDEAGSRLFERISGLQEYYLTRAELAILRGRNHEIAMHAGPDSAIIEYGSGPGVKIRPLLDALKPVAYFPVDIAAAQLGRMAGRVSFDYPNIWVHPICADYTLPLRLPPLPESTRRIAFYPGSTIGNFHPSEAATFLRTVRRTIGPTGALILGADRRKEARVFDAAYNDAEGITAEFNLHLLERLNKEFGADFHLSTFQHQAFFNSDSSRVEMHLVSREAQTINVAGVPVHFEPGETIRTEYSYKYDEAGLERLASAGGFLVREKWTDSGEQFWVCFLEAKRDRVTAWGSRRP